MFLFCFSLFELCLIPFVYLRIMWNILNSSIGLFTTIFMVLIWFFCGPILALLISCRDVYFLFLILTMHQGCREDQGLEDELIEEKIDTESKLKLYNEVRETMIQMYFELRK